MTLSAELFLTVLPLTVCLYWFVWFAIEHRGADAAKKMLTVFFGVCSVLYFCHTLLYHRYVETGLPTPLEALWAACSLSVYPIYFLYICRLTAQPASPRLTVQVLAPGLLVALAILCWNNETTDSVRQVLNALQVLSVVIFGYRRLRAFDRKLSELYAETEDKSVLPIRILLVAVLLTAIVSFVLNILGRKYVITNHGMIPFALVPMAVLLFVLGYIGSKRSFRVEQFLTDNLASDDYKVMYFYDLDSTKHISDSAFLQMRQKATTNKRYKDGLQFADGQKTKKLNFIRVKMLIQKDTVYQTFYFDDQITQVLAFKED